MIAVVGPRGPWGIGDGSSPAMVPGAGLPLGEVRPAQDRSAGRKEGRWNYSDPFASLARLRAGTARAPENTAAQRTAHSLTTR